MPSRKSTVDRRRFLGCCGAFAGSGALHAQLLRAATIADGGAVGPSPGHHPAKAKRLIFIFLTGGFSQVDTFDPKPRLLLDRDKAMATKQLRETAQVKLMPSPFKFRQCGKSGLPVSELFPNLGNAIDDICVIRSMHTDIIEHFQAALAMHTGSSTVPLPSIGAWLSYGVGSVNANLPAYVVFAEHLPYGGSQLWDASFLPPVHQGVRVLPGEQPIPNLRPAAVDVQLADLERIMLDDINRRYADARPDDLNLRARNQSFATARGMMREAPAAFDVSGESDATLKLYGLERGDKKSFAWQCLMARRLAERGVRVVELIDSGASDNWDAHGDMKEHLPKAKRADRALAGLISDLKSRGMLNDTLVAICTEFGRTPTTFNGKGREHFTAAFTCLLAGAGVKSGIAYGKSDDHGMKIVQDPVHVHDYHATILHLMGIDHTKLTYRYAGRDFRLTDVHGRVVHSILT